MKSLAFSLLKINPGKTNTMRILILLIIGCHVSSLVSAQPEPCAINAMTSTCIDACVVCDIDGFTGTNDLTIQGQTFPEFCTTIFHNMSYIAFIAGTEDLTISVTVSNCSIGRGVEIGIFESLDCQTFVPVTECNTDVAPNSTATFSNSVPLVVGQHYYLILDGSMGDICDWTFNVIEGSTEVGALTTSGTIEGPSELCPELSMSYSTTGDIGATLFYWTINGDLQNNQNQEIGITFPADGTYELCVIAANVCDQAPPTCTTINVTSPESLYLEETVCADDCIEIAGQSVCQSGNYEFIVTLANGCDSMIFLDLTVLPEIASFIDINLCIGENFLINNSSYSSSGIFEQTIQTDIGCDSNITLDLTMIECEIIGISDFTSPICNGDQNGTLLFSLENGTPPFNYSWSNITSSEIEGSGITNLFTDIQIENIPAGIYEINVSDNFDNNVVFIQEITEPSALVTFIEASDFNGYNLTCHNANDATATVSTFGGVSPYTYLWNNDEEDISITNLSAGTYSVEIEDAIGCIVTQEIVLVEPKPLEFIANYYDPNCDGKETGSVLLDSVWGGSTPYSFALDNDQFSSTNNYQNLSPGNYSFSVLDANGCSADTTNELYEIDIPVLYMQEEQNVDLGCGLQLTATTNNTSLIDVNWTNLENSLECDDCLSTYATPVNDTKYILTVTSEDDCTTRDSITIIVNKVRDVFSPNIFSPNSDGNNDYFTLSPGKSVSIIKNLMVYDRWGSLMYAETDVTPYSNNEGWDGYCNGKLVTSGVYVWIAEVEYLDGETLFINGDITLFL